MQSGNLRVGALGFDHGHITSLMRWALASDGVELVAACHGSSSRLHAVCDALQFPASLRTTDFSTFWSADLDLVLVCSAIDQHPEWAQNIADAGGAHVVYEKPLALSADAGRRMIEAAASTGHSLAVNWPLANDASHATAAQLIRDGAIGGLRELTWYGGNSGPFDWLDPADPTPDDGWLYDPARGGGSFEDYLGYGATIATWVASGETPLRVSAAKFSPRSLTVDTQSAVTAEYSWGLARFDTRWSTLSDPWIDQPFPQTGFVAVGDRGAIASYDYAQNVELYGRRASDRRDVPVMRPAPEEATAMDRMVAWIRHGRPIEGPSAASVALSAQRLVDAARQSASQDSVMIELNADVQTS